MEFADVLRKFTLLSIIVFILLTLFYFAYFNLRVKKYGKLTSFEIWQVLARFIASIYIAIYSLFVVNFFNDNELHWQWYILTPLFIFLNINQFLNFAHEWGLYYSKIHLTNNPNI